MNAKFTSVLLTFVNILSTHVAILHLLEITTAKSSSSSPQEKEKKKKKKKKITYLKEALFRTIRSLLIWPRGDRKLVQQECSPLKTSN